MGAFGAAAAAANAAAAATAVYEAGDEENANETETDRSVHRHRHEIPAEWYWEYRFTDTNGNRYWPGVSSIPDDLVVYREFRGNEIWREELFVNSETGEIFVWPRTTAGQAGARL